MKARYNRDYTGSQSLEWTPGLCTSLGVGGGGGVMGWLINSILIGLIKHDVTCGQKQLSPASRKRKYECVLCVL